jgi:hypothetical protein
MPPSAEPHLNLPLEVSAPTTNVTFAVNYELSMVDQFLASSHRKRRGVTGGVTGKEDPVLDSTSVSTTEATPTNCSNGPCNNNNNNIPTALRQACNMENNAPNVPGKDNDNNVIMTGIECKQSKQVAVQSAPAVNPDTTRRSAREKQKREVPLARTRVRYDMQMVPSAGRHPEFLKSFPSWWEVRPEEEGTDPEQQPRRSSRLTITDDESYPPCTQCDASRLAPFAEDTSVVWIPSKRLEWEDTVSEMTAVCTSAALRRYLKEEEHQQQQQQQDATTGSTSVNSTKPFHAPLSRDYIRDRVDIDDPLNGFQIRHKTGGWLQGFILWTNFTAWTYYFRWDSLDAASRVPSEAATSSPSTATSNNVDVDGSLTAELEAQPRSGDPLEGGIIFEGVAEVALVGGLGCGEYALRMALDDIRARKTYKYVVLQATESSKSFYERFGFVRVGAVCRYLAGEKEAPVQGYRHWTHANESESSLQMHGGPSYMMCLKLPEPDLLDEECFSCGRPVDETKPSFLQEMLALAVDVKPTIELLGATSTPGPKNVKKNGAVTAPSGELLFASGGKRKYGRRVSGFGSKRKPNTTASVPASATTSTPATPGVTIPAKGGVKRQLQSTNIKVAEAATKRRKLDTRTEKLPELHHLAPPIDGQTLSYNQKQYQSVWLAVPPTSGAKGSRSAPKDRSKEYKPITTDPSATKKSAKKKTPARKTAPPANGESLKPSTEVLPGDRSYHSMRCGNGRFSRPLDSASPIKSGAIPDVVKTKKAPAPTMTTTATPNIAASPTSATATTPNSATAAISTPPRGIPAPLESSGKPIPIDKTILIKQKVKSYPRSRVHFYNRVVKRKDGTVGEYFFVLNYDEAKGKARIVSMAARGRLSGKREGRPRYQAVIENSDSNFITVTVSDFELVRSAMVMKTPIVASEAWDIEE